MKYKQLIVFGCLALVSTLALGQAKGSECRRQLPINVDDARLLLTSLDPLRLSLSDKDCAAKSLDVMSVAANAQDIQLAMRYIEFERPYTDAEKSGIFLRVDSRPYRYPAIAVLSQLGDVIWSPLVGRIQNENQSVLALQNEVSALLATNPEHPEIPLAFLKKSLGALGARGQRHSSNIIRFALSTPYCRQPGVRCEEAANSK